MGCRENQNCTPSSSSPIPLQQIHPLTHILDLRRTPHPVIVTSRNDRDYIRVLLYNIPLLQAGGIPPTEICYDSKWGFPRIRGTFLKVPIIRIIVYWGLYWGPPILGNYQIHFQLDPPQLAGMRPFGTSWRSTSGVVVHASSMAKQVSS